VAPLFSVVTPVYETPPSILRSTIRSVLDQTCTDWELLLVDDASPTTEVSDVLRSAAASDHRIRVVRREVNGGIVAASNDALELAQGEFIALLDHDDLLAPHALELMAREIAAHLDVDYLYSDEDKVDADGRHYDHFAKPDWSPERLRHQMYTCHLSVLRTALVREVGGLRPGFDGSQDHDLVLRVSEQARHVRHIPEVLYHWRVIPGSTAESPDAKPYAWDAGRRAVQSHLDRVGVNATAELGPHPGLYRIRRDRAALPAVSLVIPTHGTRGIIWGESRCYVVEAVRSALLNAEHADVEVVVVYDEPAPDGMLAELREICGARLVPVPFTGPFNFSTKTNIGFLHSSGEVVVLLNDDVQAASPQWLEELIGPLSEPDVGMTGANLRYSDNTLQHGGHIYSDGELRHYRLGCVPRLDLDFGALFVNREVSGVTAACAALRREVFEEVGGLAEALPVNFNDVDLSRKVAAAGYRVVWVARSTLFHFESRSRPRGVHQDEVDTIRRRWGSPLKDRFSPTG
jgi:glycosyltransferase involved in cell wall biosynthesis